jgi:hypothetical protein
MTHPSSGRSWPDITVVVAARVGDGDLQGVLRALEPQLDAGVEVLVVDDAPGSSAALPPWVRRLHVKDAAVPRLWAAGLNDVRSPVAVLTSATLCPRADWLAAARRAAQRGHAVVGGAVDPAPRPGVAGWTVLFCRYARYLPPLTNTAVPEPPADNAVYRLEALGRHRSLWSEGFWEPFVHQALRADGEQLSMTDDLVVEQGPVVSIARFTAQRFVHGRAHGRLRAAGESPAATLAAVGGAPLVPLVMTARVGREVWSRRRLRRRFMLTAPLIAWCFSAWAAGEAVGRVDALRMRRPTPLAEPGS